jgi:hypothetical protein
MIAATKQYERILEQLQLDQADKYTILFNGGFMMYGQ